MNKKIRALFTLMTALIVYGFLLILICREYSLHSLRNILQQAHPGYFAAAIATDAVMIIAQSFFLQKIFKLFGASLSLKRAASLWLSTVPLGVLFFGISGAVLIYRQARKHQMTSSSALAATIFYYAGFILGNLTLVAVALVSGVFYRNHPFPFLNTILSLLVIVLLLVAVPAANRNIRNRLIALAARFLPADKDERSSGPSPIRIIISHRGLNVLPASFLISLANLLIFTFVILSFGIRMHPIVVLQNYVISAVLAIFSPTGGGVGAVEAGLVGSLTLSGLTLTRAGLVTITFRLINFWLIAILGYGILLRKGWYFFNEKLQRS